MYQLHKQLNHQQLRFGNKKPNPVCVHLLNVKITEDIRQTIGFLSHTHNEQKLNSFEIAKQKNIKNLY